MTYYVFQCRDQCQGHLISNERKYTTFTKHLTFAQCKYIYESGEGHALHEKVIVVQWHTVI